MLIIVINYIPSIGVHKSDSGDIKIDATVHEMAQQNNDDCDISVIGVHRSDNGESKLYLRWLNKMLMFLVLAYKILMINQIRLILLHLVSKQKTENVEVKAPNSELGNCFFDPNIQDIYQQDIRNW